MSLHQVWIVGLLLLFCAAARGDEPAPGVQWQTDLLKARALAEKTDRPLLIVFGADWCLFCKKMEATTLTDSKLVKEINTAFVPVHLDFDAQKRVADALEIEAIPCTVVLSIDADILARHDGFATVPEYRKTLVEGFRAHRIKLTSGKATVE